MRSNRLTALLISSLLGLCALPARALDPAKVAPHAIFAEDGARVEFPGPVSFAVVGNTAGKGQAEGVVGSIAARASSLSFVALLGGQVPASKPGPWKAFDAAFSSLLATPGVEAQGKLPAMPVAGAGEGSGDPTYQGWGAAFPGVGADIGLNRVASWYAFDLVSGETTWRVFVLDAGRSRIGSRWNEQLAWLESAASEGDFDGALVFMHDAPYSLAGANPDGARAEAPGALLDALDAHIDETRLKAVFFAGPAVTQVLTPDNEYGALQVGAGGGGAPVQDLWREAPDPKEGTREPLTLETSFDATIVLALNRWSEAVALDDKLVDAARGKGDFEGRPRRVSAKAVPTWGWYEVTVDGPALAIRLHLYQPDGSFAPTWKATSEIGQPWATLP